MAGPSSSYAMQTMISEEQSLINSKYNENKKLLSRAGEGKLKVLNLPFKSLHLFCSEMEVNQLFFLIPSEKLSCLLGI